MKIFCLLSILFILQKCNPSTENNIEKIDHQDTNPMNKPQIQKITKQKMTTQQRTQKYHRKNWRHWIDEDRDCQNTRHEVLIEENIGHLVLSKDGCKVISGKWIGNFTGKHFTSPNQVDIDHLIPLKEAYLSGGKNWSKEKKKQFANFRGLADQLMVVEKRTNRQKGAKDISEWLPPNKKFECLYIRKWVALKKFWNLKIDKKEIEVIKKNRKKCGLDLLLDLILNQKNDQ